MPRIEFLAQVHISFTYSFLKSLSTVVTLIKAQFFYPLSINLLYWACWAWTCPLGIVLKPSPYNIHAWIRYVFVRNYDFIYMIMDNLTMNWFWYQTNESYSLVLLYPNQWGLFIGTLIPNQWGLFIGILIPKLMGVIHWYLNTQPMGVIHWYFDT